jgi:hypothetical protein
MSGIWPDMFCVPLQRGDEFRAGHWISYAWKLSGSMPDRTGNMPALPGKHACQAMHCR